MEVRLITKEEARVYEDDIKKYLLNVLEENNVEEVLPQEIYYNMIKYIEDNSAIIVGAIEKQKLLGFIWAYRADKGKEKKYHINYFVVNRQYRKQGIGTALMNEIYKIAKQNNVSKVELMVTNKNSNAVMFYQNQNFKIERLLLCKEI